MKLEISSEIDLAPLERVIERFPEMRKRYIGFVSTKVKHMVKSEFLSGQELMLHKDRDTRGRSMVSYSYNRRGTKARLSSIPMNLFERGRRLRDGRKERGRYVITRKAPQRAQGLAQAWAVEFEKLVVEEMVE